MSRIRPVLLVVVLLSPKIASGVVLMILDDPQKERAIAVVRNDPKVLALQLEYDALSCRMSLWKARDFTAMFGPPIQPVPKNYAMTCTQSRMVMLSGYGFSHDPESKAHTDSFVIGKDLRVDVHFQRDGESPSHMYFYILTGDRFVRLDRLDQLDARVAWERKALWEAVKHIDDRWKTIVQWEVDRIEFDTLFTGRQAVDPREKLRAYDEWGEKEGLDVVKNDGSWPSREWRRKDARVASANGNISEIANFTLFDAEGRAAVEHLGGSVRNYALRWNRPDRSTFRYETWERDGDGGSWRAVTWGWHPPGEGRAGRVERDTNGDGVPDHVSEAPSPEQSKPLRVEESWAIHPKLIPAELQHSDLRDRRLPVRRIQ